MTLTYIPILASLLQNAALLLAMVAVYDLSTAHHHLDGNPFKQVMVGVVLGVIGISIMLASLPLDTDLMFDSRSVLLAVSGLFLGPLPTITAMVITGAFRLFEGGPNALTGLYVIATSGAIGMAWGYWRRERLADIPLEELYSCGLVVHLVMLATMLTLPWETARAVLTTISIPVLLIFPLATAAIGLIFTNRMRRETLERSVEHERQLLKSLFESIPDLIWLKDKSGVYMACNPRMGELVGGRAEDIIGKTDYDIAPTSLADEFRRIDNQVMSTGIPDTREELATFAVDGHQELLETTKMPMFDIDGNLIGVLGMGHDISARKRTEEQLRHLVQAVEQSTENIIITDLNCAIEYVNEAFVKATGYLRDEVVGKNPRLLQSGNTPPETFAMLWAALKRGETWKGELHNRRRNGEEFIESAIISPIRQPDGQITHYLAVKQDITRQKAAQARIEHLAHYDELTGLPNRALLTERLHTLLSLSRKQRHQSALIIVDLDHFKTVNEALGITFGDAILQMTAARLQALVSEGATLARLSADEFAILLPDISPHRAETTSQHAEVMAETIHSAFRNPLEAKGEAVTFSVSLGICLFPEPEQESASDVLRRADTALHRAKAAGGNQTAIFETAMGEQAKARYAMENELRNGLGNNELMIHLQSQVDRLGRVVGAEALLRWNHPQRGLIPPSLFIPVAEQSDLIVELGSWVLEEVCATIAKEQLAGRSLKVAVNLSPRQFRKAGFVSWLQQLLASTGADPGHLTLEVTEGLMIDNMDMVVGKMHEIAALGVRFSVDDFGTGYSSLSYLKRLPIRELKIDKSFVQDLPGDSDDAALVETIIAIARHLNLAVVAEGVETEAQADFLNARGNVIHQGFLFARPRPADQWLQGWREDYPVR